MTPSPGLWFALFRLSGLPWSVDAYPVSLVHSWVVMRMFDCLLPGTVWKVRFSDGSLHDPPPWLGLPLEDHAGIVNVGVARVLGEMLNGGLPDHDNLYRRADVPWVLQKEATRAV